MLPGVFAYFMFGGKFFLLIIASSLYYAWILLAGCNGIRLNDNMSINIFIYVNWNEVSCCLCQFLEWQNRVCVCVCKY